MMKFICRFWCTCFKPVWSKIRWCKKRKIKANECEDKVSSYTEISNMLTNVYSNFKWTADGATQLWDSFRPIGYLYNWYLEVKKSEDTEDRVQDDCDGYHSIVYHILTESGYDCALITIATKPLSQSHTMCLIRDNDTYYLINYRRVYSYCGTDIQYIVDKYIEADSDVTKAYYWCLNKYDYEKAKFINIKDTEFAIGS